jgi:peptidoglycan/xylan/chitin deacetylase (PgdA/CDA1 family)
MLDEGHIVASHGPGHDRSGSLSKEEWKKQTKNSFLELAKWYKRAGHEFTKHYYRFPYGDYGTRQDYHHINALKEVSQELFNENCIHMVFWDVDTSDWVPGMTPAEIAQNIIAFNEGGKYIGFKKQGTTYVKVPQTVKNPTAGGVVLQHDIHKASVESLEIYLKYAQENGVSLLPLNEVDEFAITKNCKL